jgi:hypothetical protein
VISVLRRVEGLVKVVKGLLIEGDICVKSLVSM